MLTRAMGLKGTAFNLMSFTMGQAAHALRQMGCRYIVTAFNPMLGFSGCTLQATNFTPLADAPIAYFYDNFGRYVTRRHSGADHPVNRTQPIYRNLLAVLGVDRKARKELKQVKTLVHIDESSPAPGGSARAALTSEFVRQLPEYRRRLEGAWSEKTVHPSYAQAPLSSKGQCGVSSVWLAQLLRMKEIEATYCYGRLVFEDPAVSTVDHHCWIEVGSPQDGDRQVIDLTCDQADGFEEPIICAPYSTLKEQGISYEPQARLTVDELPDDRVWRRFTYLDDSMRGSWGNMSLDECTDAYA
ncbi:transglutaminase-like domain-containing protein [Streptacidiphilus sp. PAMC 29251]